MTHEFPFLSLLLITGLAAFVPLLASQFRKLHVPIVVGEILAGILVGQSGLNLIETSPGLDFLATFGFTYLMFLSGLEVDFTALINTKTRGEGRPLGDPLSLGLVVFGVTVGGGLAVAWGLAWAGLIQNPLIMALILSTTSLGIVVPVLKERNLIGTRYGQALLVSALVADFATLVLISVLVAAISHGLTLDLLLVLLLLGAFVTLGRMGRLAAGIPRLRRLIEELSHATAQIQVRGAFALMVAFIVLAEWLGTEIILGAFLAGAIISLLAKREGSHLHMKMEAMGFGFFVPIFFIMVGVGFDLPALLDSPSALLLVPLLLGVAYAIKFLAALVYRLNFPWRETLAAGALLSSRLSLIIAAAAIALDLGAIHQSTNAAIILVAIVSCTLSPVLFNRLLPPMVAPAREGVILTGLGELSVLLARRLRQAGERVTLVGLGGARLEGARQQGLSVIEGDPAHSSVLERAGADSAASLVALSTQDETNLAACRLAGETFGIPHRVALIADPALAAQLEEPGTRVVQPQLATALALEGALHFPAAFDMLANHTDGVDVREGVFSNPRLDGLPLQRIQLPGDVLVLGLRRGEDVLVPHGDTVLRQGDILMLVGHPDSLHEAMAWLCPSC
ncbi:MAG: cation:proton antiporter [Anaerolineales bacterium]|nr:MAG: cation:proton antiporter [Anaerolineales bacterium]